VEVVVLEQSHWRTLLQEVVVLEATNTMRLFLLLPKPTPSLLVLVVQEVLETPTAQSEIIASLVQSQETAVVAVLFVPLMEVMGVRAVAQAVEVVQTLAVLEVRETTEV
jgi:hypothetical protein